MPRRLAIAVAFAVLSASPLAAQQPAPAVPTDRMHGHAMPEEHGHGRTMKTGPVAAEAPSTTEFRAVAEKMHHDMAIDYTGKADVDFVRGMIPHHQAAIDMAKVVLEHGKDPEIRKLAQSVVSTQQSEIDTMRAWLKRNAP